MGGRFSGLGRVGEVLLRRNPSSAALRPAAAARRLVSWRLRSISRHGRWSLRGPAPAGPVARCSLVPQPLRRDVRPPLPLSCCCRPPPPPARAPSRVPLPQALFLAARLSHSLFVETFGLPFLFPAATPLRPRLPG